MSALSPGLYRATVNDKADVIVMVGKDEAAYLVSTGHLATRRITSGPLTDARPLIVLDLDQWHTPGAVDHLRGVAGPTCVCRAIADQIEAQTKPARIPEPTVFGVVEGALDTGVKAERFVIFHAHATEDALGWLVAEDGSFMDWEDIVDPILIREGVS